MSKIRLYWTFYKSTLTISIITSCMVAAFGEYSFLVNLALCNITVGPFFAFIYKEIARSGVYYFYYNRAISKIKLITSCMILGIPLSAAIYAISVIL